MKTFLSVTIDDEGKMRFESDYPFKKPNFIEAEEFDQLTKKAIKAISESLWKDGNLGVSMAIRIISMAEAAASIDPFASVEDFWWTMLHDYLPQYEEYSNSVKTELGIKCKSKHFSFDQFNCTQTPAGIFAINSKLN